MTALPSNATRVHLDNDTDDVLAARVEIDALAVKLNQVMSYLTGLFGSSGDRAPSIATLFSGQAVLFPPGTSMIFWNATVPAGWVKAGFDLPRHLVADPGNMGGQPVPANFLVPTTFTSLTQAHLPNVQLNGFTHWVADHAHTVTGTSEQRYDVPGGSGVPSGAYYHKPQLYQTSYSGAHFHDVVVYLGGLNHGHNHTVDLTNYRPHGWYVIIGTKT